MFRQQVCHPQGARFVTMLNYISTIAALAKINKIFKILKLSSVIKWLGLQLFRSVYDGRIYSLCVDIAVVAAWCMY
jgi:hypothetical protein